MQFRRYLSKGRAHVLAESTLLAMVRTKVTVQTPALSRIKVTVQTPALSRIKVTVQPSATLLLNPAHFKFAFGKVPDSSRPKRIFTDFAASAKSCLHCHE